MHPVQLSVVVQVCFQGFSFPFQEFTAQLEEFFSEEFFLAIDLTALP